MTIFSKLRQLNLPLTATFSISGILAFGLAVRRNGQNTSGIAISNEEEGYEAKNKKNITVNKDFITQLGKLIKIMIPSLATSEFGYCFIVATLLISRTLFDILILRITTAIERSIVSRSMKDFKANLSKFFLIMIPVSFVNCLLKYGQMEMALRFRIRLTKHLYDKYLKGFTYYRISNLDNRIKNVDQLLTADIERFTTAFSLLYSNLTKPILDIIIFSIKLSGSVGMRAPVSMLTYLIGSGIYLTWLRQPTGKFTIAEQKYEGNFRCMNSRLITNSEEIAFYNGNEKEKKILFDAFNKLVQLFRESQKFKFSIAIVDNVIAKYLATVVGFILVSKPFLDMSHPRHLNTTYSVRMEDYFRSGKMMIKLSEAMGRLVLSGRELTRLAGFTSRITDVIKVLDELNNGKYERKSSNCIKDNGSNNSQLKEYNIDDKRNRGEIFIQDHIIKFQDVPLITPSGEILIKNMNFTVNSGMNLIICGPNGCGKSSLFRILGELWPLSGGKLTKPEKNKLFYIPQRPYLTPGTLRDQIIYPHSFDTIDNNNKSIIDNKIKEYLNDVQLEYLIKRNSKGFDTIEEWSETLSGGEKQRVAMARLFYHQPQFAILDECTSAVSIDVEGKMYEKCKELKITLFTVSHRKSLWKYHEYVLQFDGQGNYEFKTIDTLSENEIFGS